MPFGEALRGRLRPDVPVVLVPGACNGALVLKQTLGLDVLDDTGHPLQPNGGPASPDPTLWFAGMRPNLVSYFWGAARDGAEIAREIAGRKKRLPSRVKAQRDTTAG